MSYPDVLVYVVQGRRILLAEMVSGKIGKEGVLNGYDGKMKSYDATSRRAVLREFEAKTGGAYIRHEDLIPRATIRFCSSDDPIGRVVMVYAAYKCYGDPVTTEEMANPAWYPLSRIPYDRMMPGDDLFLPRILDSMKPTFSGVVEHDPDGKSAKFTSIDMPVAEMGM